MTSPAKPTRLYANIMLTVLLVNIPLCFLFIGLLLLIPIGAWQMLDAVVRVSLGDRKRIGYLIISSAYLGFLWYLTMNAISKGGDSMIIYMFVIPYTMAFYYWGITRYHACEQVQEEDDVTKHLIN